MSYIAESSMNAVVEIIDSIKVQKIYLKKDLVIYKETIDKKEAIEWLKKGESVLIMDTERDYHRFNPYVNKNALRYEYDAALVLLTFK